MSKITIKDVAKDAGVSLATASFAINNRVGRVSLETKERVLTSAKKLGYIANVNARNLRTKASNTYMLVYDEGYLMDPNASTIQFVSGAVFYSAKHEKDLLLRTIPRITDGERAAEDFMNVWNAKQVDGVIFQIGEENILETRRIFEILTQRKVNFVIISPNGRIEDFPSVYIDDYHLMEEEIAMMYSKGYREIYHLTRKTELKFERERGYLNAIHQLNAEGCCLYYEHEQRTEDDIWNAVRDVVENRSRKIAFACWNDVDAIFLIKALKKRNIKVPAEVGVMGFDDSPAAELTTPPLTTVRQPFDDMASKAVDVLSGYTSVTSYNRSSGVKVFGKIVERDSV